MVPDLVIGIDSSTSATKAIAWDRNGRAVAEGRASIATSNPRRGYFEQDPAEWWASTATALRAVSATVSPARIAALAIANQRESFGLFDEQGEAVGPATLWLDERARQKARRFGQTFGAARVHAISGKPLDVIPCLYRMIWFREEQPEIFAQVERMAEVQGYLVFRLSGRWVTSTASADPMGVLDMRTMDWSNEILEAAGIARRMMPDLARPGTVLGQITPEAAISTGLREGTPIVAGGGDGQCAGTGAGVLQAGCAYINLGTAVVSGSYGTDYVHDPAFRTETAVAEDGYIYETCLRAGTFLVDWMTREMLGVEHGSSGALETLEAEATASPIGAGGIMLLPYWQGVMDPHWDSAARGVIVGLSGSSRRGDVYRAVLEGIALHQAATSQRAAAAVAQNIDHFIAIGGGAKSDLWMQILADALDRPVKRSTTVEASSLGAAMAAAKGAGWFSTIAEASLAMASEPAQSFDPDAGRAGRYAELLAIHADLWPTLSAWNQRLAAFTEADHG
ncbi:xylulose kinase [Mesorhizobium sp. M7A.F.Ca.US.011.01.1.1]|uniref:xylulokinase n=1 Tax=unclassified Mesorhizobium TaxID=325217 RepID=UPI000FCC4872|nr:FGGY-family carbohydrate kinase [Mesorhizobium sp. M7A.F.Ca.US.011.01.1.1]RUX24507.1 xylulose kinase [Mesorhizobium sp. M7A.F.Ca.US.011.01.1.1]